MILDKNLKLFYRLYMDKISLEKMFGDVLDRKQAFPVYKKINFIWSPNWIFPKGLGVKILKFLHYSFLGQIGLEIVFEGGVLHRN